MTETTQGIKLDKLQAKALEEGLSASPSTKEADIFSELRELGLVKGSPKRPLDLRALSARLEGEPLPVEAIRGFRRTSEGDKVLSKYKKELKLTSVVATKTKRALALLDKPLFLVPFTVICNEFIKWLIKN